MGEAQSRETRTIVFTDVEGSTALRTGRGDDVAGEVLRVHETIVRDQVTKHGGREIKALGDGFMLVFASVRTALACAVAIQQGLARHNRDRPELALLVRVGLNAGEVIEENGDLFGEAVNAAARITALAGGGEVLVSRVVKELAGTIPGLSFVDRGAVPLKGFPDPSQLYEVAWRDEAEPEVLTVRLLGDVDLRVGRERLHGLESPRLQSLLGFLILRRHAPQARQRLAFLLWPDSTEAQARTNLRQLLHHLRRALPDADRFLELTPGTVQWRPEAPVHLDVADFEQAATQAAATDAERRAALEQAAAAYGGDLLPGCYEEWVLPERERLRQCNVDVLERLATQLEAAGDYSAAIRYGEMLLRCDPVHEATYRRLMRVHARSGERARALRVYHTCATVLERELGVEPSPPTREAYADLVSLESLPAPPVGGDGAPSFGAAPLVGRQAEWERATRAWHEAAAGQAQLLLVAGEAGLGKTRLVEELERWCARQGIATARTRAYAAEGRMAYAPVVEWLRSEGLRPILARLEPVWLTEIARLLPELLTEHPDLPRPEPLTGGEQRPRLFEALARAALAGVQPLLLVIDDLQWCDQETLEFLHYLVRFDPRAPLLVAATARPEEIGPPHRAGALLAGLHGIEKVVEISLSPLDRVEVSTLAQQLSEKPLAAEAADRLYRETEGNPLFVVETVRAGLLAAPGEGSPAAIPPAAPAPSRLPPKVRSAIQGRLNRLSPEAGELVAVAATVGREFTHEVLTTASGFAEDTVVAGLDELWRRRIIREQGLHSYDFSHDKIREVAYGDVGPARRRQLHLAVAGALSALHAADLAPVSGQLGAHYERAGQPGPAVVHYQQAAGVAQGVFANEEVVPLLTRALELLERLPPGVARDDQELALRIALGPALVALQGYNGLATIENYVRADDLCLRLGHPASPPVLRGLGLAAIESCEFDRALEFGRRLLTLGEDSGEPYLVVEGHYLLGVTTFWRGELTSSRDHLERAIATYRPEDHRLHVSRFAQDPKVVCLCRLALTLWHLGCGEESARAMEDSLALAESLGHPMSRAYALMFGAWLAGERGDLDGAEQHARALEAVSVERGFVAWAPPGEIWRGWTEARRGRPEAGVDRMLGGFRSMDEAGMRTERTYLLVLLSQAQTLAGQPSAALSSLREALEHTEKSGQRYLEAELQRMRAELLLGGADDTGDAAAEADAALRSALDVSRRQGARLFELRAATSLARWRTARGSPEQAVEARAILEQVLEAFPEASNTADLDQARRLLRLTT